MPRLVALAATLLLVLTACGTNGHDAAALSPEEYGAELAEISDRFAVLSNTPEPADDDLLNADLAFGNYEDAYDALHALVPPPELASSHERFIEAFGKMQHRAADLVGTASLEGGFTLEDLGEDAHLQAAWREMFDACAQLARDLADLTGDTTVVVGDTCSY